MACAVYARGKSSSQQWLSSTADFLLQHSSPRQAPRAFLFTKNRTRLISTSAVKTAPNVNLSNNTPHYDDYIPWDMHKPSSTGSQFPIFSTEETPSRPSQTHWPMRPRKVEPILDVEDLGHDIDALEFDNEEDPKLTKAEVMAEAEMMKGRPTLLGQNAKKRLRRAAEAAAAAPGSSAETTTDQTVVESGNAAAGSETVSVESEAQATAKVTRQPAIAASGGRIRRGAAKITTTTIERAPSHRSRSPVPSTTPESLRTGAAKRNSSDNVSTPPNTSTSTTTPTLSTAPKTPVLPKDSPAWLAQTLALRSKFPSGWAPRKRLSPAALEGIRSLHAQHPDYFTTPLLADQFKVSPEVIRRILKSKWKPSADEEEERVRRWERRGESVWKKWVEEGRHAPRMWRQRGIGTGPRRESQDRALQKMRSEGQIAEGGRRKGPREAVPWG